VLQDAFARAVASGANYSDAYRAAGYSDAMGDKSVNEASSRLMRDTEIISRIQALRDRAAVLADIDAASVAAEMEHARQVALEADTPQVAAAVTASRYKANLAGLLMPATDTSTRSLSITASIDSLGADDLRSLLQLGTQAKALESGIAIDTVTDTVTEPLTEPLIDAASGPHSDALIQGDAATGNGSAGPGGEGDYGGSHTTTETDTNTVTDGTTNAVTETVTETSLRKTRKSS
jgi:phage terminase small subunit